VVIREEDDNWLGKRTIHDDNILPAFDVSLESEPSKKFFDELGEKLEPQTSEPRLVGALSADVKKIDCLDSDTTVAKTPCVSWKLHPRELDSAAVVV
jgi:hypothetical protein